MFWYLLISAQIAFSMPASHLVTNLPGVPSYSFQIYSGYLQIPNSGGKELHYMFYTSQNSPANDPVVLWLNGGPGCSSMEGAFMENGPFIFSETNNTMFTNPYSWNRIANMLYLEAPAGVGYSMMGNINNNSTNDTQTASDNLQALLAWYALFPEFVKNSFYIAGESYSGVYVPYLATYVLQYNSQSPSSLIPIKGILVGNPVTDWNVDADSAWPAFLYWHQIIDDSIYVPWVNLNCSLLWTSSPSCDPLAQSMYDLFTGINYYDIYRECIPVQPMYENHKRRWMTENLQGIDNCVPDNALILYMNNPKVRNALHINTTLGAWSECADLNYFMNMSGSYFLYPNLINTPNFIINIYSGDTDSSVPTEGTRAWINNLGLTTNVAWAEWYLNKQVAGMYTRYGTNFRFNTIRGAGHMCIQWLPAQGFTMFQSFLMGVDLPLSPQVIRKLNIKANVQEVYIKMGALCHKEDSRVGLIQPAAVITAIQNYDTGFKFCQEDLSKRLTAVWDIQYNWTYLHLAVWMNKEQIVENLLRIGSDVNIQDTNGDTALHLALITGQRTIAKSLLENGARFDIANVVSVIKEGVKAMELMTGESIELMKFARTETEVEELGQLITTDSKKK